MGAIRATQDNAVAISNVYEQEQGYKASNTVVFGTNPADSNTITLNGTVFTYRDTPSVDNDVQVGADISASIDNLLTEALPTEATYTKSGTDSIVIEYGVIGIAGNDYTIACNFTSVPSNLEGGSDTPDGDWIDNTPSIDYELPEIGTSAYYDGAMEESTSTALKTNTPIAENDNVRLYNATDGVVEGSLGTTTTTTTGTTDTHDIFSDGSAVATYNLDGNANDLGGNYNGTATNVTYEAGKFGQCGVFNGTGSEIIPNIVTSNTSDMTFSLWVKDVTFNTNGGVVIESYTDDYIFISTDQDWGTGFYTQLHDGDTNYGNISTGNTDTTNWKMITLVHKLDTGLFLYENGVEVASILQAVTQRRVVSYDMFTIGRGASDTSDSYRLIGKLDQVRIFNRALTSDEVNTLYTEQSTKYTADISALALTNPPTKAYFDTPISVATVTEANAGRCIAQDEVLTKVSSTLTNFTGTNTISGLIESGDSIQIDGSTDVVCSDVVESNLSTDTTGIHDVFGDGSAVATYNLDGNANDLGGNYDGTSLTSSYIAGKFGDGIDISDFTSKYMDETDLLPLTSKSMSVWIKGSMFNASTSKALTIINTGGLGIGTGYNTANPQFKWGNGLHHRYNVSIPDIDDGAFHHFVLTSDGTNDSSRKLYIDNTDISLSSGSEDYTYSSTANIVIGDTQDETATCIIDQVRIFNRALTATEINTLYNEQVPLFQYDCTIPAQGTAPTSAKVLDRSTLTTEASDVYDDATGKFTKTYNKIDKQGRAFKYKIEADENVEVSKVTIPMNKEG